MQFVQTTRGSLSADHVEIRKLRLPRHYIFFWPVTHQRNCSIVDDESHSLIHPSA